MIKLSRIEFEEDIIHEDVDGDADGVDDANGDDDDAAIDDAYGGANADDAYDYDSSEFGWFDAQYYSQYFFSQTINSWSSLSL